MKSSFKKGFTLLELMVSLAIFAFMTAFLLAKYGTFNQSVILTDLAYDTAITIRNAQASALNVQGTNIAGSLVFSNAYGVHFGSSTPTNSFITFVNTATPPAIPSTVYSGSSLTTGTYTMKAGDVISGICVQQSPPCIAADQATSLDVTFQRPNPDAILTAYVPAGMTSPSSAYITVSGSGTASSTRTILIQSTGEIAVMN